MQFLHGYSDPMIGYRYSLGNPNPDEPSEAAKKAGEAFANAFKAAKTIEEVNAAFTTLVDSFGISQKTLDDTLQAAIASMMAGSEEGQKVNDFMQALAIAKQAVPALKKVEEDGEQVLQEALPKPFKDAIEQIRAKIVSIKEAELKGASKEDAKKDKSEKADEGLSTAAKIAIFGGGALALGGIIYFATQPKASKKR